MDQSETNRTLKLVHVIFRHGHRTTDASFTYPNDPHKNEIFHPYGCGQLTNEGKLCAYKLGQSLRKRYNDFLGELYIPGQIDALSSDSDRTKATLQLVLAGIFPPKGAQIWNEGLLWQPIPYSYTPIQNDKMFFGLVPIKYYMENNLVHEDELTKQEGMLKYLTEHSGMDITNSAELFFLYCILATQEHCKLKLPKWTSNIYPEPVTSIVSEYYSFLLRDENAKRLAAGSLLRKIVEDSVAKISAKDKPQNRKMHLYSGHEVNIAYLLITLGLFKPHVPPYLAHVIIEVHTVDGIDGLKFFYQDYTSPELQVLKLPNCDEFCPLEKFMKIVHNYTKE